MADLEDEIGTSTAPLGYDPDGLWNYEFGMKWTAAEGRVILNAAIFRMDWNDIQVGVSPLCGLNGTVLNAGKAKSEGFELELDAVITENFRISGGISYVDATFSEDVSFWGSFIFASAGTRVPDVAEWTGNIRADYTANITDTILGFARATLSYRGDRLALPSIGNTDPKIKDAYEILNVRLGIDWHDWTFTLFVDNLTNSRPSFTGLPLTVAGSEIQFVTIDYSLRPIRYGLSVRYGFY